MAKKYDLIVIGAGPGGLLAARAAAEHGLDVALLEKKTDITKLSRACLQTLDSANEYLHHDLYMCNRRDGRLAFPAHGFSVKYDSVFQNLNAWQLFTPNGHIVQSGDLKVQRALGDAGRISIALDKEMLLRGMLEEAEAVSVDVFPGINVSKITQDETGVEASGGGRSFSGRYLIAADGANSAAARIMGLNEGRYYYLTLHAISYYMTGVTPPEPDTVMTTYGYPEEGAVFLYLAPLPLASGDVYNVMPITADPRVNLKDMLDFFKRRDYIARWFEHAKTVRTLSAACNVYSPINKAVHGRVLLVGDTGSTQELEITGALISGWKAGNCVATAVREATYDLEISGIGKYNDWWHDAYINAYDYDNYLKAWGMPYIFTNDAEVDDVFGLIKEPFAPAFNPYTMPHHMGQAFKKIVPTLQEKRPDLLQKLGKTKLPAREIFKEITKISKPV